MHKHYRPVHYQCVHSIGALLLFPFWIEGPDIFKDFRRIFYMHILWNLHKNGRLEKIGKRSS